MVKGKLAELFSFLHSDSSATVFAAGLVTAPIPTDGRASAIVSPRFSSCRRACGATAAAAVRSSGRVPTASTCSSAPPTASKVLRRRPAWPPASPPSSPPAPPRREARGRPQAAQLHVKQRFGLRKIKESREILWISGKLEEVYQELRRKSFPRPGFEGTPPPAPTSSSPSR